MPHAGAQCQGRLGRRRATALCLGPAARVDAAMLHKLELQRSKYGYNGFCCGDGKQAPPPQGLAILIARPHGTAAHVAWSCSLHAQGSIMLC